MSCLPKERVAANALELAHHGVLKPPFYLTGQVGGRNFSLHAEGERVSLSHHGKPRQEVDLMPPEATESSEHRRMICELAWDGPAAIWAMDFTYPLRLIDGVFPATLNSDHEADDGVCCQSRRSWALVAQEGLGTRVPDRD